jgi:hypothetical protein
MIYSYPSLLDYLYLLDDLDFPNVLGFHGFIPLNSWDSGYPSERKTRHTPGSGLGLRRFLNELATTQKYLFQSSNKKHLRAQKAQWDQLNSLAQIGDS